MREGKVANRRLFSLLISIPIHWSPPIFHYRYASRTSPATLPGPALPKSLNIALSYHSQPRLRTTLPSQSCIYSPSRHVTFHHTNTLTQVGEVVFVSGSIKKQEGGKKKKKTHCSKKTVEKMEAGDTSLRNLRPNYFVGIQISNEDIHKALIRIQEDMVSYDESLFRALVDVATSHITLLVAHVDTEEALSLATSALAKCGKQLMDDLSACPLQLTFSGISHFGHQVVYAQLVEDDHYHRLLDLAEYVRNVFGEGQVFMPDKRTLHPHLTIAKLSKAPRMRGKHAPRKIDPSSYKQHLDIHLGCQTVTGLQLLAMNKSKDHNRYYYNSAQVMFDIKCKDNMDHTQCCFPRRPILKSQRRT
ncbi:hypothetical protein Pmani_024084 [Petrolisthes manimaculis]|uniref:A-kinase anchor protein 7-like phosphoesterase domain-containing protein n=1 Tax=Petrolisthes manimaculis TaxID=1843537 RepID=A0AAE1PAR4_9EUCA|nr:hypothetical protein Pmani_024084 [Petrolisthes manimaculis]